MSLIPNEWSQIFEKRSGKAFDVSRISPGPSDRDSDVLRFLRQALVLERIGAEGLVRRAESTADPEVARCLAGHAEEELGHVALLSHLVGEEKPRAMGKTARWVAEYLARDCRLDEYALRCLLVEAAAIALYELAAERLAEGRAREVLRNIAGEERLHIEFTRDLLVGLLPSLPDNRLRGLRRRRSLLVAALMLMLTIEYHRGFRRASGASLSFASRRVLTEIERSLAGVPGLSVPPAET